MSAQFFSIVQLLEKTGFVLRGATRADCIHCQGHSRGTVAFTTEVAFCHRCKWTANIVTLAKDAGVLRGNSTAATAIRDSIRRSAHLNLELQRFDTWRQKQVRMVSVRYRSLSRNAVLAADVLAKFPECDAAWDALAEFYHTEARLLALFDWFMFTKVSTWLELDSTAVEVFATWRQHAA
ncbi:MAG: hypothetical protein WB607_06840 [Candidatus Acidiferrum sp.]